jgi:hypothetical protein
MTRRSSLTSSESGATDVVDRKPVFLERSRRHFGFMPASEVFMYTKLDPDKSIYDTFKK